VPQRQSTSARPSPSAWASRATTTRRKTKWLRELTKHAIDDYDTFRAKGLARLPAPTTRWPSRRRSATRTGTRSPTPSGKIEIYSMSLAARPDPYGLGAIPPIPTWIPEPIDPLYPLRLVTPKSRARTHSIHDNQSVLSRADRERRLDPPGRRGGPGHRGRPAGCACSTRAAAP